MREREREREREPSTAKIKGGGSAPVFFTLGSRLIVLKVASRARRACVCRAGGPASQYIVLLVG